MTFIISFVLVLVVIITIIALLYRKHKQKKQHNKLESFKDKRLLTFSSPSQTINAPFTLNNINVYLINMKKNHDRLFRFANMFSKTDMKELNFTRIEGVDGRRLNLSKYVDNETLIKLLNSEKNGYRTHHYELTRGAVGCYLAHMNVYREISKQKKDYALVLEDDVKIMKPESLFADIKDMVEQIPVDWDILLLGCVCFVCGKFRYYYDVNRYFLMHGYLIKKSSAENILHLLENEPIQQQIDALFSDLAERDLLKIYCLKDKLAVQWDMGTNIQIPVKTMDGVNPYDPISQKSPFINSIHS